MMALMTLIGALSGFIAKVIEELTYLVSILLWEVGCYALVGCLDFIAPLCGRGINSGVGSGIDAILNCGLQTFLVPCAVGFERVCMPYLVEILQQVFNILG
jgi:hypothetical protein